MRTICERFGKHTEDVFVVGSGPSLAEFDYQRLTQRVTIALNDATYRFRPTYHLFHDKEIAGRYADEEWEYKKRKYWKNGPYTRPERWLYNAEWGVCQDIIWDAFKDMVPSRRERILAYESRGPDVKEGGVDLWCESTVSTAGIQLAWKLGATRIYLLGVDACCLGRSAKAARYATDTIEPGATVGQRFTAYDQSMKTLRKWVEESGAFDPDIVVNLSPITQISVWRKQPAEEVL